MTERRKKKAREPEKEYREVLKPKTVGHAEYIRCMSENTVTFCTGPAGSSKSYSSLGLACQYLLEERVDKIIIARPAVEAAPRGLGFLPGSVNDKLAPYVQPAVEHMQRFLGKNSYAAYRNSGKIIIEAMEYLRGRTFNMSFIIGEEFQNCTTDQIKMFVTRIGEDSKMVINGDVAQTDVRQHDSDYETDLEYVIYRVKKAKIKGFGVCELTKADIVRHPLIGPFLQIFE